LEELHLYGSARLGILKKALALRYRDESGTVGLPAGSLLKRALAQSSYQQLELGRRRYELSNHLGNVLATVSDKSLGQDSSQTGQADYYLAQVSSASLYYPFGWEMPGRKFVSGEEYRFGFNGQEEDPDMGVVFKYRVHDARVGRFLSVDPLSPDYPWNSCYAFAENRVIDGIDLEGLEHFNATHSNSAPTYRIDMSAVRLDANIAFLQKHKSNIESAAMAYGVSKTQIGLILIRENRHYIYQNNSLISYGYSFAFGVKEEIGAPLKNKYIDSYEGNKDRWSPGIAQMQVKHGIRMLYNLSIDEYDQMKSVFLQNGIDSDLGQEYLEMYNNALDHLLDEEKAITLLAKYVSELNNLNPNSTNEEIAKDYMRGPHLNRDPNATPSEQALKDWADSKEFENEIKEFFNEED